MTEQDKPETETLEGASPTLPGRANRDPRWRSRLGVLGAGVATYAAFRIAMLFPSFVEAVFSSGISPVVLRIVSLVTGLLPFALLEILIAGYFGRALFLGYRAMRNIAADRRNVRNVLACLTSSAARDIGVLIVMFYVLWGFNYARTSLRDRLGWEDFATPSIEDIAELARQAVERANQDYVELHDTTDAGVPTTMPADLRAFDRTLEAGWVTATNRLGLDSHFARTYGPTKRLLLTPLVAAAGISGFFFPWTGEANVLWDNPAVLRPQSMAHEKAHQRGVGPEEEASFLGYVAGSLSPDPLARYSADVFAQLQLLRVLTQLDLETARSVASERLPGVQRDIEDASEYWARRQGIGMEVGRAVNNQFLKANRVRGGIANYRLSVQLLITYLESSSTTSASPETDEDGR